MARNQRKYNTEYKVQAVKLSNEIGSSKAAVELGIPVDTLYGWVRAVKEGRLDIGGGAHTPQTANESGRGIEYPAQAGKAAGEEIRRLRKRMNSSRSQRFFAVQPSEVSKGQRMKFIA